MLNKKRSDHTTLFNKNLIIILLLSLIFVLQGCVAKEGNHQEQAEQIVSKMNKSNLCRMTNSNSGK